MKNVTIKQEKSKYLYHAMCGYLMTFDLKNIEGNNQNLMLAKAKWNKVRPDNYKELVIEKEFCKNICNFRTTQLPGRLIVFSGHHALY